MKDFEHSSAGREEIEPAQIRPASPVVCIAKKVPEGKIVHTELGILHRDFVEAEDVREYYEDIIRTRLDVEGDISFVPALDVKPIRVFSNTGKALPSDVHHDELFYFAMSNATGEEKQDKFGQTRSGKGMEILEGKMRQYRPFSDPNEEARCEDKSCRIVVITCVLG